MARNLKATTKLSPAMTLAHFDNGYWYTTELKAFAKSIGIPSANKLRKDELETAIKFFLETGKLRQAAQRSFTVSGTKDVERGLSLELPVMVYTNDTVTKNFLEKEAQKMAPGMRRKSGARYRLNRWREAQLVNGIKFTYRDLVEEYVRLNQTTEPFAHIPHGRYINFMSDFLAKEQGATREQALKAWGKLKTLDIPKNYQAWTKFQSTKPG